MNGLLFIMKKLILIISAFLVSSTTAHATPNWVQIQEKQYIDINSIQKENYLGVDNLYSFWTKALNDNSRIWIALQTYNKSKLWFMLNKSYIDCINKRFATKEVLVYDINGNSVYTNWFPTIPDSLLKFQRIAPGTVVELVYDYICTGQI